jgi:uncharacterized protein (TIGR03435 family)
MCRRVSSGASLKKTGLRPRTVVPAHLGPQGDIEARLPAAATKDQMRTMLQNLLAERFHRAWHRERQDLPAAVLTVANGRMRLPVARDVKPTQSERNAPGFRHLSCSGCSIGQFVKMLGRPEGRIVFDETGLTGTYDFELTYEPVFGVCRGCTVGGSDTSVPPPPPPRRCSSCFVHRPHSATGSQAGAPTQAGGCDRP